MGKQFEFYSHKNDDEMIANTLRSVFGELLCVPHYKGDLSPFDICANDRKMYLTGKSFQQYISYYTHEYYDGTTAEVLDYVKSPVLEYRVPFQREDMAYIAGRFYCCSDNNDFSQMVSKFFRKIKKKFLYVKFWKCYISNFDCSLWQIDDWGLYTAKSPIYINSLGSDFNVWFDVDGESFPTDKQLVAWAGFCNINSNEIKEMMIDGLTKLVDKMDVLPNDVEPEFGPIYRPMAISRNAKRSIEAVRHSRKTLGKVAKSTLKCNSVVVPLQDKAPVRFIVMNFEIGRRPYEMEAVFCNERMLMVGENSGIWTRLEWINEFNVPMFNIGTALHPYWRPE